MIVSYFAAIVSATEYSLGMYIGMVLLGHEIWVHAIDWMFMLPQNSYAET